MKCFHLHDTLLLVYELYLFMECAFLPFSCDCHSLASWEDLMWHLWWGCASVLPSTSTTGTLAPVDVRLETWQQCVSHAQPDTHGGKCLDQSEQGEQTQWLIDALIHAQLLLRIHKWSMTEEISPEIISERCSVGAEWFTTSVSWEYLQKLAKLERLQCCKLITVRKHLPLSVFTMIKMWFTSPLLHVVRLDYNKIWCWWCSISDKSIINIISIIISIWSSREY